MWTVACGRRSWGAFSAGFESLQGRRAWYELFGGTARSVVAWIAGSGYGVDL